MRPFFPLIFFVFACLSQAQQASNQSATDLLQLAVQELPTCALTCTITTLSASECELTDVACIKANKPLQDELSVCVRASCTIKESLTAKAFLQTLLGAPRRNKERIGTLTTLIAGGFAVLAFLLRVIARLPIHHSKWGPDDWIISLAMVFVIPLTICAYVLNQIGMGKDMWYVSFDHITQILEIFYFTELLYFAAIGLTKISILLFYLRIFPDWKLRRMIYGIIGACIAYMVVFIVATALQCIPVSMAWQKWDGEHQGKCLNLNAEGWASAIINIILDLIVIILPMRQLKDLAMSWRRKLGVMIMFLGGGFVTIVSILRLKFLIQFAHTDNVTWDYLPVGYWSAVETHVGIIVACAPAIRSLTGNLRNRFFPKPASQPSYYDDSTAHSSSKRSKGTNNLRNWGSKNGAGSRLSSLSTARGDKEFVQIDEYEMDVGGGGRLKADQRSTAEGSEEGSVNRSHTPYDDIEAAPLATTAAPIGRGVNGIMVQTDFTVGRS